MFRFAGLLICALMVSLATADNNPSPAVDYPDDYAHWTHVKSLLLHEDHPLADPFAGLHHIYANPLALQGMGHGEYARGAVFVFDLFEAVSVDAAIVEGPRKLVGVMEFDAERFSATGGWGFEGFAGDSRSERLVTDGGASCFACHQARKAQGYVFTEPRPSADY